MNDYAIEYDKEVLNGNRVADQDVKQQSRLDLIERKKALTDSNYPYYFDQNIANEYINLAKLLSPKELASFQLAFIANVYGWRMKSNHGRRYSEALYTMSRKNAKSYVASLILCSELLKSEINNEANVQLYILATSLNQSCLTLRTCKDMIKRLQQSSKLARGFKLNKTMIYSKKTGSRIQAVTARPGSLNGCNPRIVDIDEVEAMRDDKLLQVMKSAMALQPNGLILLTSTAGFVMSSPVITEWKACESALKNKDLNSRLLPFIYTQDNREEIFKDPSSWIKSNPLLENPEIAKVMKPYLKNQLHNALAMNTVNSTITKNFNRFGNVNNNSFISPDKWKVNTIKPIDLRNRSVTLGVDLSRTRDLTSVSLITKLNDNRLYTDTTSFIPTGDLDIATKQKRDGINYEALERLGFCHICRNAHGFVPDDAVPDYLISLVKKYHFKTPVTVAYDKWGSDQLVQRLGDDNRFKLVMIPQNPSNLGSTIMFLYKAIMSHKLVHLDNPLFTYGFHNIEMKPTFTGIPYFNKQRNFEKIDNIFSLITGLTVVKSMDLKNRSNLNKDLTNNESIF